MSEYKFIITGTPGAGKTTAITTISDFPPVSTDMETTDDLRDLKDGTTVAMDFGQMQLPSGDVVNIYGTPGQDRFKHMWEILVRGGLGLIILIDYSRPSPLNDLRDYLEHFDSFIHTVGAVVGISHVDDQGDLIMDDFQDLLESRGLTLPILAVDCRRRDDVLMMLEMLMSVVEANSPYNGDDNEPEVENYFIR